MKKLFHLLLCTVAAALSAADGPAIRNRELNDVDAQQFPRGWRIGGNHAGLEYSVAVETDEGGRVLALSRITPMAKNRYFAVAPFVENVTPGIPVEITFDAKGTPNAEFSLVGGAWNKVFLLKSLHPEHYTPYRFRFTPTAKDFFNGSLKILFILDGPAEKIRIRNLDIKQSVAPQTSLRQLAPGQLQAARLIPVPHLNRTPDGALRSFPDGVAVLHLPASPAHRFIDNGKADSEPTALSARIGWADTPDGLLFMADVDDPAILTRSGGDMYLGDGVQLQIVPAPTVHGGTRVGDMELGAAPGIPQLFSWTTGHSLSPQEAEVRTARRNGGYFLTVLLRDALFRNAPWRPHGGFSFNAVINDRNRENGPRRAVFLAPGIHLNKSAAYNTVAIATADAPYGRLVAAPFRDNRLSGRFVLPERPGETPSGPVSLSIVDQTGKKMISAIGSAGTPQTGGMLDVEYSLPVPGEAADGKLQLELTVGGRPCASTTVPAELRRSIRQQIDDVRREFERLAAQPAITVRADFDLFQVIQPRAFRLADADLTEAERRSGDAAAYYRMRAANIIVEAREVNRLLSEKNPIARPDQQSGGCLTGYGHFMDAIRDIPIFGKISARVLQTEIGPGQTFPQSEGVADRRHYDRYVGAALRAGKESNVGIILLMSPHIIPEWWKQKYPASLAPKPRHQMEYFSDWNDPEVRRLLEAHLTNVADWLKNDPNLGALHSICLSNEAKYQNPRLSDPVIRRRFQEALQRQFATIATFNRQAGTDFATWDALTGAGEKHPAVRYAFQRWKQCAFADSHAWMSRILREKLPGVRLHTKLPAPHSNLHPEWGTDIALFSDISDLNGNDSGMAYKRDNSFIAIWQRQLKTFDMQYSFRPAPVVNTENHIIADGDFTPIPYEHIYGAMFEQAVFGAGAVVTWVWNSCSYAEHLRDPACDGSIYYRPLSILAHAQAARDVQRLAEPIREIVQAPPEVAILHAPSSLIQNGAAYVEAQENCYLNLAFTGRKIGYLREDRLELDGFGKAKTVFLPGCTHLAESAWRALAAFADRGGRIVTVGAPPQNNAYGKPYPKPLPGAIPLPPDRLYAEALEPLLPPPLAGSACPVYGVVQRAVQAGKGRILVNLVNYNYEPVSIRLRNTAATKSIRDLITGKPVAENFRLAPLMPLLLEIHTKKVN